MWPACFKTDTKAVIPLGLRYVSRLQMDNPRGLTSVNKVISHSNQAHIVWPSFKLVSWFPFCCSKLFNSRATPGLSTIFPSISPAELLDLEIPRPDHSFLRLYPSNHPQSSSRTQYPHHPFSPGFTFFPVQSDPKVKFFKPNSNIPISSLCLLEWLPTLKEFIHSVPLLLPSGFQE